MNGPDRLTRCSQRILARVPVLVRGSLSYKISFEEETEARVINAHGGLILLATRVTANQALVLKHRHTGEDQECIVAYLGAAQGDKLQVGLKFTYPNPSFWGVAFPPDDWNTKSPRCPHS